MLNLSDRAYLDEVIAMTKSHALWLNTEPAMERRRRLISLLENIRDSDDRAKQVLSPSYQLMVDSDHPTLHAELMTDGSLVDVIKKVRALHSLPLAQARDYVVAYRAHRGVPHAVNGVIRDVNGVPHVG